MIVRVLALCIACVCAVSVAMASPESDQELISTWISLESQKGHLKEGWLDRKESMEQKLALFDQEIESISELLKDSSQERSDVDKERQDLLHRQTQLEKEQALLAQKLELTLSQMKLLIEQLPPPVRQQWQAKLPTLLASELAASEQLEGVLKLLKQADEYDRRVVIHKGAIDLSLIDHSEQSNLKQKIVVNQIYLGLSHAWYVSDDGSYFGYGKASLSGWAWWPGSDASKKLGLSLSAQDILSVLEVLHQPTSAKYLALPLSLDM